ncbi:MAG: hypothetical protein ACREAW_11045 [Nitrososphaera sp.]
MQDQRVSTYHVTMDDDKLGVKPEVLVGMYTAIDAKARQLAPQEIRNELVISQDGRIKTKFYIQVSNRMAPHIIAAIQQQAESEHGIGMRSYFYKLQEQIMSQMFAGVKDVIG